MSKAFALGVIAASWLACGTSMAADPLGRLFFSPGQRSALDAGRTTSTPQGVRAPAARGPRTVTLNGVVTRSDGESTVWVNGQALDGNPISGVTATPGKDPASARVRLDGTGKTVNIRVGQSVQPSAGVVVEPYEFAAERTTATTAGQKHRQRAADPAQPSSNPGTPSGQPSYK